MRRALILALALLAAAGCSDGRNTALTEAAATGDEPELVRLLAAGEDPNELDDRGWSPLVWAARSGHARLVGILISRGADPDLADGASNGWTPMMHAIDVREMDAVRALLNRDADPDVAAADGRTALMLASAYGYSRIVRLLLERGADPRVVDADGSSALDYAVGGVAELDHVTKGECQTETVAALAKAAPGMRLEADSWALRSARLKRCEEIVRMVAPAGG
jgi:ankyrin repeat protein